MKKLTREVKEKMSEKGITESCSWRIENSEPTYYKVYNYEKRHTKIIRRGKNDN